MMIGMDENTGKRIEGIPYLEQRIKHCLGLRLRTAVMRPNKGCDLPNQIDAPMNSEGLFEFQVAALDALSDTKNNGLSDFQVDKVTITPSSDGIAVFNVSGTYLPNGKPIQLDGIEV